ncbi:MAG TPA: hypothetical protein VKV20_19650 [Ktedonobacteraceae bacterium]|jgi:hypothetical protein|nr:hypothetical protein [Ktedonobacteraceae bacterium]
MTQFVFPPSAFLPLAIGFFGLGTGYFVWGGHAVFGYPKEEPDVSRTMGMWAFWMPGFMQFITGITLLVGLTWFNVFAKPGSSATSPLYMAALAFTAYGIHWFAMAHRRFIGASALPDAWMAIAFFLISILGVIVFAIAGDVPVVIVFIGLSLIYLTEAPTRFSFFPMGARLVGIWQLLTGIWLMYLTFAVTLNFSNGLHLWV